MKRILRKITVSMIISVLALLFAACGADNAGKLRNQDRLKPGQRRGHRRGHRDRDRTNSGTPIAEHDPGSFHRAPCRKGICRRRKHQDRLSERAERADQPQYYLSKVQGRQERPGSGYCHPIGDGGSRGSDGYTRAVFRMHRSSRFRPCEKP